jgi:hypothetical protein
MNQFIKAGQQVRDKTTGQIITARDFGNGGQNFSQDFEPVTNAPVAPTNQGAQQPDIRRDENGNIATLTNPTETWKNKTVFMQTAKDIIKQKQSMNQDLNQASVYWKTLIRDTSPFGGVREPIASQTGTFTDERMRQLSPEDQASVRASRTSAVSANLEGIAEERKYREASTADTLQVLKDLWTEKENLSKEARDTTQAALDAKKTKLEIQKLSKEIGYQVDEDGNVIRDVTGASVQDIANTIKEIESSGDYKAKGASGEFGAYQFMPSTWESWSQEYLKSIKGPAMSLEMTPEYQDRVAQFKIQQWLDKGYTPEQIASLWNSGSPDWKGKVGTNSKGVKYNTPAYVERFRNVLAVNLPQDAEALELTDAVKTGLMSTAGLTNVDVKGYTPDDWILLKTTIRDSVLEEATVKINGGEGETGWKNGFTVRGVQIKGDDPALGELIRAQLVEKYGNMLDASEIDSIMLQSGFQKDNSLFSGQWKKAT